MTDKQKSKQELIQELDLLRQRMSALEQSELVIKQAEKAVRATEERFKSFYQKSPIPTFTWQKKGGDFILVEFNLAAIQMTDDKVGNFIGRKAIELYRNRPQILNDMDICYKEQSIVRREILSQDFAPGRLLSLSYAFTPPDLIMVHAEDITERKRAEEALLESERRYRLLAENVSDVIWTMDMNFKYTYLSPSGQRLRGYTLEEAMAQKIEDVLTPTSLQALGKALAEERGIESLKQKDLSRARTLLLELRCKDGTTVWTEVKITALRDSDGQPVGFIGVTRDITERNRVEEALKNSEHRYQQLVEQPFLGIHSHSQGQVLFMNHAGARILGAEDPSTFVGKSVFSFIHPDYHEIVKERIQTIYKTTTFVPLIEEKFVRLDGKIIDVEIAGSSHIYKGRPAVQIIFQDITERKRAEETLRESMEEAKRLAQENALVAEMGRIISSTPNIEEVFEHFSEAVAKLIPFDRIQINLGSLPEDDSYVRYVAGTDVPDRRAGERVPLTGTATVECFRTKSSLLLQPKDAKEVEELGVRFPRLLPNLEAGMRSAILVPLIAKDETIGVLSLRTTKTKAYADQDVRLTESIASQIAGAVANSQLYDELKLAEGALRESGEKFRDLYNNAPVGYHEYNAEGRITNVNQTDLEMLGYTAEEMIGQLMWKFNVEEEIVREEILAKLAGTLPPARNLERTYRRKDGTTFPVLIEDRLILDEKGQIKGIRCTIQDITERKKAEAEMAALQEQLRQSQKIEAIGLLAGGIAHDFNNLLTIMKTRSQLALMGLKKGDPLRESFEAIEEATTKAARLTRQILAFSRRQVMEMIVLDLNTFLRDLENMLRRIIGEDIELLTVLADGLGRVKTDPGQIEQVVFNLAVNARDAMPQGGEFSIETANVELDEAYARAHVAVISGRYVMLAVSDTGVGMTPEVRDRVFEPFFTTKEKGKGTGLGLSTVYGIVKQSGGNIWVYSEPGQGTTFKIYLPRVDEALGEIKGKAEGDKLPLGWETILVVEDEEEVRKLAALVLQKQGYRVLEAAQGGDAFLICEQRKDPIHLMLTDVVMPRMSGRELAERLASLHPEMRVLYMSGYTDAAITHHGILEEGVNFLQKPFTLDGLARKVREVLDKDPQSAF